MPDDPSSDKAPPAPDPWNTPDDEIVWSDAHDRLRGDARFGRLVEKVGPVRLPSPDSNPFRALARAIVFQQLAGAAARTIWGRVEGVLGGELAPDSVARASDEALRGAGLSGAKLAALRDLSRRTGSGELDLADLSNLPDAEVVRHLTTVRGIGPWTAQMFLMFDLRRPDVWPVLDLGVRVGWGRVHGLDAPPDAKALDPLGEPYRPWRSAVAWYCWRVVDTGIELP